MVSDWSVVLSDTSCGGQIVGWPGRGTRLSQSRYSRCASMAWLWLLTVVGAGLALSLLRRTPDRKGGWINNAYKWAAAIVENETLVLQAQLRHASEATLEVMITECERTRQLLEQTEHSLASRWEQEKQLAKTIELQVARARLEMMKEERAVRKQPGSKAVRGDAICEQVA
jgi:hypothetical protein